MTMPSSSSNATGIEVRMEMAQITINEGLAWLKTLKKRQPMRKRSSTPI